MSVVLGLVLVVAPMAASAATGPGLSNDIDNGAGLMRDLALAGGQSVTRSSLVTSSPDGTVPLTTRMSVDPSTVAPGSTVRYTVTVENPGSTDQDLQTVTGDLPAGFAYVAGSSTGATTADPTASGGTLTWATPVPVGAQGQVALSFDATASGTEGSYPSSAGGTAAGGFVTPTGSTATVTVTATAAANQPPHAVADTTTTPGDTPVTVSVRDNDTDPDGDALTVTSATPSADHGTVACTTASCTYTAARGFVGTDTFGYTVSDDHGGTDSATVTVTVSNRPPDAVDDEDQVAGSSLVNVAVLANDTDPDDHVLTVLTSATTDPQHGSVSCGSTGRCGYRATLGYVGPDTFTYTISDGHGGTDTATVTVTVDNRRPFAAPDSVSTFGNTPVTVNVLPNDTDQDGHPLTVTSPTPAAGHGTASCTSTTCTYTADLGYVGPDTFDYTISDGHGGVDAAAVLVDVRDRAPVALDDTAAAAGSTPVTVAVLDNDSDPDGHPLHITTSDPVARHGTATCTEDVCTYTADLGYAGTDAFTYAVGDGKGGTDTAIVTVTVSDRQPHAVDDTASTTGRTPVTVNVLTNDTDPDLDELTVTSPDPVAARGTVACTLTACTYTSATGVAGPDAFTYTVGDGRGGAATGTVRVTVTAPVVGSVGIATSRTTVAWPQTVTVSAVVRRPNGTALPGVSTGLWSKPAGGSYTRLGASLTSSATGGVSTVLQPQRGTTYQWRVDGSAARSGERSVTVTPSLTVVRSATRVAAGAPVVISGVSSPARAGAPVRLQRLSSGVWSTVRSSTFGTASTSTTTGSPYSFSIAQTASRSWSYRVLVPADAGRLKKVSPTLVVTVYKAAVTAVHPSGDEYVTVKNTGAVPLNLQGWRLTNATGTAVTLPARALARGASVRVHTGSGTNRTGDLYLRSTALLGDLHDTVRLLDAAGFLVSSRRY